MKKIIEFNLITKETKIYDNPDANGPEVDVRYIADGSCHCENQEPVPYESDGALGHGWECGKCGGLICVG